MKIGVLGRMLRDLTMSSGKKAVLSVNHDHSIRELTKSSEKQLVSPEIR